MKTNKIKKSIYTFIIYFMFALFEYLLLIFFIWLKEESFLVAEANPELQHMRVPVLILMRSMTAWLMIAVGFMAALLHKISIGAAYSKGTVKLIRILSLMAFISAVPIIILIAYTIANVNGSITNLFAGFMLVIATGSGSAFALIAQLVEEGERMKSENDLTI